MEFISIQISIVVKNRFSVSNPNPHSIFVHRDKVSILKDGVRKKSSCEQENRIDIDFDQNRSMMKRYKSKFLSVFGTETKLCLDKEIDSIHIFGRCQNFHGRCTAENGFEIWECHDTNSIFDPDSNRCRDRKEIDRCSDQNHKPEQNINRCSNEIDDPKFISTGLCESKFLACVNGMEMEFRCEKIDFVFDEENQKCRSKIDFDKCPIKIIIEPETTTMTMVEPIEINYTCEGDGGFHVNEKDCTKYYRCAHGRLVQMDCADGTAWDESITGCNHKHLVSRCQNL